MYVCRLYSSNQQSNYHTHTHSLSPSLSLSLSIYIYIYIYQRVRIPLTEDMATSGATSSQVGVTKLHNISLMGRIIIYTFFFKWRNWYYHRITMTRKSGKHRHATYRALNSCFDLIRSHQQCTPWSPPPEIEPTTTVCRMRHEPATGSCHI